MQEFVKSFFSLGIAASLFPLKQIGNIFTVEKGEHQGAATKAMDSITNATVDQFGGVLRGTFSALDNVQRGLVSIGWAMAGQSSRGRGGTWSDQRDRSKETPESVRAMATVWPNTTPHIGAPYRVQGTKPTRIVVHSEHNTQKVSNGPAVITGRRV